MKSFFKKLAFVMALAMVVTLAAPAAQTALAATEFTYAYQEGGKVTTLNMEAGDTVDLKFIGVLDYKNYDLKWVSTNEKVATVDNKGVVTAVADGKAEVELQVGDGTVYTSKKVAVNVGEVEITSVDLGTAKDDVFTEYTLEMGQLLDLNFYGVTDWAAGKYACTWTSTEEDVATVDNKGVITPVGAGETTVTVQIVDNTTGNSLVVNPVVVTVKEAKVSDSFTAAQTTDTEAVLTFENTELTKEQLEAGLAFYYYVGDVKISYPIKVDSVKEGVAKLISYVTFVDGTKYGFEYAEEVAEFTASIGEVASIQYTWSSEKDAFKAYIGKDTKIDVTLLNAKGVDITKSALANSGASVLFTLVEDAKNGEYWISNATEGIVFFNDAAVAQVKIEYITGKYNETTYEPIPGPVAVATLVGSKAPAFGIDVAAGAKATITTSTDAADKLDWGKASTVIALGDDKGAHKLVVQMLDNKGNKIYNTDTTNGSFRLATTNNSILYVDDYGYLMTNGVGIVNVLVYFTPAGTTNESVVAVVPVNVRPARAVSNVSLDKAADVVSTEGATEGFNKTEFKVTLKDQLDAKIKGDVKVTCNNTRLPEGVSAPVPSVTGDNGEYTITILGGTENLPKDANGYTYTYTVKVNDTFTKTFSVTVRKPMYDYDDYDKGELVVSGYKVEFTGDDDLKSIDGKVKNATVTLYILSNGVKAKVANLEVKPDKVSEMKVGNYYYYVTKGGAKVDGITDNGSLITIPLTSHVATSDSASGSAVQGQTEVKKTTTGSYNVVIYKGVGTGVTGTATASTFTQVASNTLTVKDSEDTMAYAGKINNSFDSINGGVEALVQASFKFKLGGATLDAAEDYKNDNGKIEIVVNANKKLDGNTLVKGSVCFVKSVDFYVPTKTAGVYVKYTVNVNDYVEVK